MEKDNNNLENDEDQKKESKSKKSKYSKSSTSETTETNESKEDKSIDKDTKNREKASFFKKKESEQLDDEEVTQEDSNEEEPGLSEEEVHEATIAIVDSLTQEVADELVSVEPDSSEEFEALADAVFLDELLEIAEGEEDFTEESINQAFNETLRDLNIDSSISEVVSEGRVNEDTETMLNETVSETDTSNNINNEEDATTAQSSNTASTVSGPPPPPSPPTSFNGSTPQSPGSSSSSPNYNYQTNNVPSPNVVTKNVEIIHGRRSDMLVGAIIGYIVGRRGGRKRTEKKLQPKINKLEEQVRELQYKIINKEAQVRTLARQKAESHEKINQVENTNTSLAKEVIEQRQLKKKVKEQLKRREELAKDPGVEKIGKFSLPALKVFHERRIPDGFENSPKRKQVETMTASELLDKIGDLRIEGYEVRTIYKNGRLTTESLRQITKEYLRGGPYKQTFIRELLRDNQEIEKSRETINNINSNQETKEENNTKSNKNKSETISKEEAMKRAEALLMTQTVTVSKPNNNRVLVATFTFLIVIVCIFIIVLLS